MKIILQLIFWACFFVPVYNYGGYAIIVMILNKIFPRKKVVFNPDYEPEVTLLIAAYNEENEISEKIINSLALDYPHNKLRIAFVTDGSTDRTPKIITAFPEIELYHEGERRGKSMAINRVMPMIKSEIVIFCDANTDLNKDAVKKIVRHYADPEVGGVSGEKKINPKYVKDAAGQGEGLYWKYESILKKIDSEYYSVVGAAGELFSIRTALYQPVEPDTILDDFMISLRINKAGYRIIYEPGALAMENPSAGLQEESKRKVRIAAGGFQSIFRLLTLLNVVRYGRLSFLYISHRVLRWLVTPFLLPVLFVLNILLVRLSDQVIYDAVLIGQTGFYILSLAGWLNAKWKLHIPLVNTFYYFFFMNVNVYAGLVKYLSGKQSSVWVRSERVTR